MSDFTEKPSNNVAVSDGAARWTNRWRLMPFCCFMLSGILLDIYFYWYSFHFAAHCSDSGNSVPSSLLLFTAVSLLPAGASIVFGRQILYRALCLGIWIFYCGFTIFFILDEGRVNCYRDVWGIFVVSHYLTLLFAIVILALTFVAGMIALARRLFSAKSAG